MLAPSSTFFKDFFLTLLKNSISIHLVHNCKWWKNSLCYQKSLAIFQVLSVRIIATVFYLFTYLLFTVTSLNISLILNAAITILDSQAGMSSS